MPEYLSPAVYVEEVSGGIKPIEGVGTSTGAFIGVAEKGPIAGARYGDDSIGRPVLITNFGSFQRTFGGFIQGEFLAYAVQQFFAEGGTRCYVARTAHFEQTDDPDTLTARRAGLPLAARSSTTLAADLAAGATQAELSGTAGLASGMELLIRSDKDAAHVRITSVAGNTVEFENTAVDPDGNPLPVPDFAAGTPVGRVVLQINAIDEGEWGNNLRIQAAASGLVETALRTDLPASALKAELTDVSAIRTGMTLFITNGTNAARVQVTRVNEGDQSIDFAALEGPTGPISAADSSVTGIVAGKASTVLAEDAASGDSQAVLQSRAGIQAGSVLLILPQDVSRPDAAPGRVVVKRVIGNRILLETPLTADFQAGDGVFSEDFTLTVFDGDDVVETHAGLSMHNSHLDDYVESRINKGAGRSRWIRVHEAPPMEGNTPPASTPSPLRLGEVPGSQGTLGDEETAGDYLGSEAAQTGFFAFDSVDDINILSAPGVTWRAVLQAGMTYCENRADCFFVGDVSPAALTVTEVLDFVKARGAYAGQQSLNSRYGALYWPWVRVTDPLTQRPIPMAPAGAVVGTYSATDVRRGVHKAPAGIDDGFLNSVVGVEKVVTMGEHDLLNPEGINVIRSFPDAGIVIWGARTTSSDPEWRYVNVRRLFLFLEESIDEGTQWVVFEPNDSTLWARIIRNVSAFLRVQWAEGKLVGATPEEAFFVKCDAETNPPESVDLGRVITEIGVAPSKPAEFVIFRISQIQSGAAAA